MKAVIRKKEEVADRTEYVEFETEEDVKFIPGQYFYVTLDPKNELHKEDLTHHLSIVNSPNQKRTLALTTRMRVERSLFKRTLDKAKVGDEVEIGKIGGEEFSLPESTERPIVLIALGIGITPYISMLRYCDETRKPYKFTLFYSDGEEASMPFLDEIKAWERKHAPNFKFVQILTQDKNWPGETRHVDGKLLKEYLTDDFANSLYYVSGPPQPAQKVIDAIKAEGVPEDQLKMDDFYGY